nr:ribonuclease H-like domain-containing protein [Tanacetum cinerariifolium]
MLANAKLPVTFWAEAVNTACYVQNMVLVNKSQNKTSYELFNGRTPAIGFLKPFGCHVMILNTLDHLGKFKAKGDEGYFIRYSMSSKAFRVFNKRTKRVEENLHVDFLENKAIEKGAGPNWLFNIDTLTNSMNYVPMVVAGTNSTNFPGTKDAARQDVKKDVSSLRYIALSNWFHEVHLESSSSEPQYACNADAPESSRNFNPTATSTNPLTDQMETLTVETPIPTIIHSPSFSGRTVPLFNSMLVPQGEGSGTPTEPHHTATSEASPSPQHELPSSSLPPAITETIPTIIPLLLPYLGNIPEGLGLLRQDMANKIKTSTLPHESTSRVTSLAADEGILKARLKLLEDKDGGVAKQSGDDAPIKGRSLESREETSIEKSTEKGSNDTDEMVATVSIPHAGEIHPISVPTGSSVFPTASPIFTTTTVVTLYTRRKSKEKMVESETPKKRKIQEQIDVQMARELGEEMARDA